MAIDINKFNSLPQQVEENKRNIENMQASIEDIDTELGNISDELIDLSGEVDNKQDTLIAGENITIVDNVISASGGGGGGGGLTEIITDDIYFSTFFNTYPDGVYILSATAQNTQITVHLGVDDLSTETLPFGNPNQKMLMFVNNEYQINPFNANIKWKGITIINGGGANSVYDIRQRVDNPHIHTFNVVNNLPTSVQDLMTSKFNTIFGSLDIPQFIDMYQPENNQNNKYILMPDYQQNFDITNGTGNVLFSLEYGDASSSIVLVKPFVNQFSDAQCCSFTIYHGSEIIVITYDYTNEQLLDNKSFSLYNINRMIGTHNVVFGFKNELSPTPNISFSGIIKFTFESENTTPIASLSDLAFQLYNNVQYGGVQARLICTGGLQKTDQMLNTIKYVPVSVKCTEYDDVNGTFKLSLQYLTDITNEWNYSYLDTEIINISVNDTNVYVQDDVYLNMV